LTPKLVTTSKTPGKPHSKGGVVSYEKFRRDILRLLNDSHISLVTSMLDFYGLPDTFPGKNEVNNNLTCYQAVELLEQRMRQDINNHYFLPYLSLHELEALLFVDTKKTAQVIRDDAGFANSLNEIRQSFKTPEEINSHPETAPSKRLFKLAPEYQKTLHAPLALLEISVDVLRANCQHFNQWVGKLESISQ
jgi:hypothetical protein